MKKIFLSILTILCLCGLSANSANTTSINNSATKQIIEKTSQPQQDGRITDKPLQEKPYQKLDKKPDKKPNQKPNKQPASKPGGDKVPPEFQNLN